ncbi:hypothetical protein TNCV_4872361 [Trichonephila clavipes]|nr:hypothetical protein TNCV_4872361 [Trichonephila clavipes]
MFLMNSTMQAKGCTSWMERPEFYCSRRVRHLFHAKIVEVEIGGVTIYRPFGEFHRTNSYCHLYGAQGQGQRQA